MILCERSSHAQNVSNADEAIMRWEQTQPPIKRHPLLATSAAALKFAQIFAMIIHAWEIAG